MYRFDSKSNQWHQIFSFTQGDKTYTSSDVIKSVTWSLNGDAAKTTSLDDFTKQSTDLPIHSTLRIDSVETIPEWSMAKVSMNGWDGSSPTTWYGETYTADKVSDLYLTACEDKYLVEFDANGGSGEMDRLVVDRRSGVPALECGFTNDYATFIGWSTIPDGDSEEDVEFKPGSVIPGNALKLFSTLKLYAIWKWNDEDGSVQNNAKRQTIFTWGSAVGDATD